MTFPTNTAAYVDTPWTDPNGIQWIYNSVKTRWARYRVAGGGTALTSYVSQVASLSDYPAKLNTPQAAATASIRKIGTGATDAAAGNHTHADLINATASPTAGTIVKRDGSGAVEITQVVTSAFGIKNVGGFVAASFSDNLTANRALQEPNAAGVKALTADTQGRPDALFNATIRGTLAVNSTSSTFGTGAALAFSTAQFGNVGTLHQSLMSGGAGVNPSFGKPIGDYTWATRPSAATYDGYTIRITDVCAGGSLWTSNGTRWYPVSKSINLVTSGAAISSPNSTSEQTLVTVTVPAGMMDANTRANFGVLFTCVNNANAKQGKIKFGGTTYSEVGNANRTVSSFAAVVNAANSVTSQKGQNAYDYAITGALVTSAHDTTAAVNFTVTATKAVGTDAFILEQYFLTLIFP